MKKQVSLLAFLGVSITFAQPQSQLVGISQMSFAATTGGSANAAGILVDDPTHRTACKIYGTGKAIHAIDANLNVAGTTTGITGKFQIETDSSDAPSNTLTGTATIAFAVPSAAGWTGLQALGSDTEILAVNTPYWIVYYDGADTAPSGTNYTQLKSFGLQYLGGRMRQYNGTNWTTTTVVAADCNIVVQYADGTYGGNAVTGGRSASSYTKVYGTNRQGLSMKVGASMVVRGVLLGLAAINPSGALEVELYRGATLLTTQTVPAATIVSGTTMALLFSSPQTIASGATIYVMLHQAGDAGGASQYYSLYSFRVNSTYINANTLPDTRLIYGTGTDPTAMTAATDERAYGQILTGDSATDITGAVAGTRTY